MKNRFRLVLMTLAVVGLLAGALGAYSSVNAGVNAQALAGSVPVIDLFDHNEVVIMNPKKRGTSELVRNLDGWQLNVDTTDLPVGAYSIWALIFNEPSMCSDGICGRNDMLPPPGNVEAGMSPGLACTSINTSGTNKVDSRCFTASGSPSMTTGTCILMMSSSLTS